MHPDNLAYDSLVALFAGFGTTLVAGVAAGVSAAVAAWVIAKLLP